MDTEDNLHIYILHNGHDTSYENVFDTITSQILTGNLLTQLQAAAMACNVLLLILL